MQIICDFDGTITQADTTDFILERLADPSWRTLEEAWVTSRISAAECMRGQIALIAGSRTDLDALLDAVDLDPGFAAFVGWCEANRLPISIASDGVDYFIRRILERHGLQRLDVVANRLAGEAGAWRLEQPWARAGCAGGSGVCKCEVAASRSEAATLPTLIYVGDGRSDFCVSARADFLFAKGALADYAAARGQAFHPFETFHDVTATLAVLLGAAALPTVRAAAL
ncbi:MAG: MtnX-like HAD-IB family phosphatase [Phenylobacterium sp.]|uniref:MtnX-like HAD-IB family phosphatase n=1 Tax=Phenylobacterium sp. TaxID=1871053 RepID=UPI0025DDEB9F|nr:MtnX-like HAD-IB family phosphatase [Phenylobacterium sp.]MBT9470828.1 MtnX-like HAD-IB family phosphatase [Phenylobacterium sp.]